jgi:hypothetical protein
MVTIDDGGSVCDDGGGQMTMVDGELARNKGRWWWPNMVELWHYGDGGRW